TIETMSLYRHFREAIEAAGVANPGHHFVAITDADTSLVAVAREQGFLQTFVNPGDIGGRYSALSWFGLVPMALGGIDIAALIDRTGEMAERCGGHLADADNPAVRLGAFMGACHAHDRVILNLVTSPELSLLGDWLEQLIAESTGKRSEERRVGRERGARGQL